MCCLYQWTHYQRLPCEWNAHQGSRWTFFQLFTPSSPNNTYSYTESKCPIFFSQFHKVDPTGIGFWRWWKTRRTSTLPQTNKNKENIRALALPKQMVPLSSHLFSEAGSITHQKGHEPQSWANRKLVHNFISSSLYDTRPVSWSLSSWFPNPQNWNERSSSNCDCEWCPAHSRGSINVGLFLFLLRMQMLPQEVIQALPSSFTHDTRQVMACCISDTQQLLEQKKALGRL